MQIKGSKDIFKYRSSRYRTEICNNRSVDTYRWIRKGIGQKLLHQFERHCLADGEDVIKANVSIYSIPFYEANGYRKTTGVRNQKGLKIQPMKKWLTNA